MRIVDGSEGSGSRAKRRSEFFVDRFNNNNNKYYFSISFFEILYIQYIVLLLIIYYYASIVGILHFKIELNRKIERFLSSSLLEQCERRLTGREKNNDLEEKKER